MTNNFSLCICQDMTISFVMKPRLYRMCFMITYHFAIRVI